jgi:prolyl-tRNA synthetase
VKFADADLMGMPFQVVVSEKNMRDNRVEIKNRKTGAVEYLSLDNEEIVNYFKKN